MPRVSEETSEGLFPQCCIDHESACSLKAVRDCRICGGGLAGSSELDGAYVPDATLDAGT
jgi:hypothetical protein